MIVSYTWSQDAKRVGALARGKKTLSEKDLLQTICHDLQLIHEIDTTVHGEDYLLNKMQAYKIHDWYADADSCGMNIQIYGYL